MDEYTLVILLAFFGFVALAAILLVPVYLFLKREEEVGRNWTREELARRAQEQPPLPNGTPAAGKEGIDG